MSSAWRRRGCGCVGRALADAGAIERYCSRWEVAQHTARIPHPYPPGSAERFIFAAREGNASGRDLTLVLTPIRDMREAIGAISLEGRAQGRLTLGYALAPEAWGKGLASEAVEAMVEVGFGLTEAIAIVATTHVDNPSSRRVLEKAGFAFVGSGPRRRARARRPGAERSFQLCARRVERAPRRARRAAGSGKRS